MCAKFVCVVLLASLVCGALALPSQDSSERDLVNMLNRLDTEDSVPLFGGLRIDRSETGRSFGAGNAVESFEDRAERYLETHELNLSFSGDEQEENSENEYTGRAMEGECFISYRLKKKWLLLRFHSKNHGVVFNYILF